MSGYKGTQVCAKDQDSGDQHWLLVDPHDLGVHLRNNGRWHLMLSSEDAVLLAQALLAAAGQVQA